MKMQIYNDRLDHRKKRQAGSVYISEADEDGEHELWFICPCGCSDMRVITVGDGFKPSIGPSWKWNGSLENMTLTPSVNINEHWHGYLTDGEWIKV